MQVFMVLSAVLACALSQGILPAGHGYSSLSVHPYGHYNLGVYPYAAYPYAAQVVSPSSQYHAQDVLGQFTFGSAGDNQARVESKSFDGTVTGAYSYVDPTGKLINVNYLADHNGFRVLGANNLPEAPAAIAVPELKGPEPVQDTPEVMAARAAFMMKFAEVKAASEAAPSRKKRQAIFYSHIPAPTLAKSTLKYSTFEPVEAKVPADTKKIELKEKETEVLTPLISPLSYAYNYGLPAVHSPFYYHY